MDIIDTQIQLNGGFTFNEWSFKVKNDPNFLGVWTVAPGIQSNIQRSAVLGYFTASNEWPVGANVFQMNLMPATESRTGLGQYGKGDININIQNIQGHRTGSPESNNVAGNPGIKIGRRIENWDYFGNDKINVVLKWQISITKAFSIDAVEASGMPQAIQWMLRQLMQSLLNAYEDICIYEFTQIGINLNHELVNGQYLVCDYVDNPVNGVNPYTGADGHWVNDNASNINAFVALINNVDTYCNEIELSPFSEIITKPIFCNKMINSKAWVFNSSFSNTRQTEEMRYGLVGNVLNGRPIYQASRMSDRYGSAMFDGKSCPDFFLVDRSRLLVPKRISEALHLVQAPSDWHRAVLMKALEWFTIYATPVTLEDYQAQLYGKIQSAAIGYGYLITPEYTFGSNTVSVAHSGFVKASDASNDGKPFAGNPGIFVGNATFTLSAAPDPAIPVGTSFSVKLNNYIVTDADGNGATGFRMFYQNAKLTDATHATGRVVIGLVSQILQDGTYTLKISDLAINGKSCNNASITLTIVITNGQIASIA